jgi:hypothetical protein
MSTENLINNYLLNFDLPSIPDDILESSEFIINQAPVRIIGQLTSKAFGFAESRWPSDKIVEYVNDIFKGQVDKVYYLLLKPGLYIHIDSGRNVAFNYLIDSGGDDATTCFYSGPHEDTLICSKKIKLREWHKIKVDTYHTIVNLVRTRIVLTATLKNVKVWEDPIIL